MDNNAGGARGEPNIADLATELALEEDIMVDEAMRKEVGTVEEKRPAN